MKNLYSLNIHIQSELGAILLLYNLHVFYLLTHLPQKTPCNFSIPTNRGITILHWIVILVDLLLLLYLIALHHFWSCF